MEQTKMVIDIKRKQPIKVDFFYRRPEFSRSVWITSGNFSNEIMDNVIEFITSADCPPLITLWCRITDTEAAKRDVIIGHYLYGEVIPVEAYRMLSEYFS